MSSTDLFEEVRLGRLTPRQGAELLAKRREEQARPKKPSWLPRPIYIVGMIVLALVLPRLVGRGS